jgi:hypothetical protein
LRRHSTGSKFLRLTWESVAAPERDAERWAKDHIEPKAESNPQLARLTKWEPDNDVEIPRKFSDIYLNRLGNLVLDNTSLGAAKGSKPFVDRIENYKSSGLRSQKEIVDRFANRDVGDNYTWDERAIRARHKALMQFAMEKM